MARPGEAGRTLSRWWISRGQRGRDVAATLEASTPARHLSFIEGGRPQPSPQMVLRAGTHSGRADP